MVSVQPQAQASLLPSPVTPEPTALFPCDDPQLMAQYMPNYPPLQPGRVMSFQPAISREEMIYPSIPADAKYETSVESPQGASSLGIQHSPYIADVPVQTGAITGPYAVGGESSPYDGHGMIMSLSSRFHPMHGFDVRTGMGNPCLQDESSTLDFPPHKTAPVKRGPFKDQDSREKTALTRKMGSCIRCRMQRIRVSSRGPFHIL